MSSPSKTRSDASATANAFHTFMQVRGANTLVGSDHGRKNLIALMRTHRIENSGEAASRMGHTLVLVDYDPSPLFIEAAPPEILH